MMSFFGKKNKKAKKSIEDLLKEEKIAEEEQIINQETTKTDVLFDNTDLLPNSGVEIDEIEKEIAKNKNDITLDKEKEIEKLDKKDYNLEKFDFIKEGEKIDNSEGEFEGLAEDNNLVENLLDFSALKVEEEIAEEEILIGEDDYLSVSQVGEIFDYLHKKCEKGFVSGFVYNNIENKYIYKYNSKNSLFSLFSDFFAKLENCVSQSEFEKQNEYYLVDLKENKLLFVLTYEIHHFVFVFDKTKVNVGFILYILKHNIDTMYRKTQNII